jgi:predicted acylesterase/phospholipase RssA
MTTNPPPPVPGAPPQAAPSTPAATPFGDIALSFSGGGYRAAAYHLGVLDLLDELGLLKNVTMLSTVSGGTITGVKYVLDTIDGKSHEEFRAGMYAFLRGTNVVQLASNNLYTEAGAAQGRPLSLIRAAAQAYADRLVGETTFDKILSHGDARFKELTFNATEFRTGVAFRFLKSQSADARFGNGNLWVEPPVARNVRLADVIAASSCFPGAFEPINFPGDFRWPSAAGQTLDDVRGQLHTKLSSGVPLMDGGIYDNQGFSSLELAGERLDTEIGLVIISDTNQRQEPLYESPVQRRRGGPSIGTWWMAAAGVAVLSVATAAAVLIQFFRQVFDAGLSVSGFISRDPLAFVLLYLMPFALAASTALLLLGVRSLARRKRRVTIGGTVFDLWGSFKRLTIPDVFDLLETRFGSLYAIASAVFLKRVRGLLLTAAARDKDYEGKLIFAVLYEMNLPHPTLYRDAPWLRPSESLQGVAAAAEGTTTALWSEGDDSLNDLAHCGRATMCFNLLRFLIEARDTQLADLASAESELFNRAKGVWELLTKPLCTESAEVVLRTESPIRG